MGTIIKTTAIFNDDSINSSIESAAMAAKECIKKAEIDMQEIDLLLNVGVYRDNNMVEPAMAALIQKEIGINPDYIETPVERAAFSCDLMNGGCGFMNAIHVSDALLKIKKIKYALIVSSNTHPSQKKVEDFPFNNYGSAMILEYVEDDKRGFQDFKFRTSSDGYLGKKAYLDLTEPGGDGRQRMTIEFEKDYPNKILNFTLETMKEFIKENNVKMEKTKVLTSQKYDNFNDEIVKAMEIPNNASENLFSTYGDVHSCAPVFGYQEAIKNDLEKNYDSILFSVSGSGLTCGCALYNI